MNFDFIKNINIDFNAIISYLTSFSLQEQLFPVKIAFLAVAGLLLAAIIFFMLRTHYLEWLFFRDFIEFFSYRPFGAKKITRQWNKILRRLEARAESEHKLAVIEADDMLEATLKRMGYAGATLEERLEKLTAATIPGIDQVYGAHRLRNNIVRDPDYSLSLDEAKKTLDVYDKAFRDLQILT